jgi:hypothetical protein
MKRLGRRPSWLSSLWSRTSKSPEQTIAVAQLIVNTLLLTATVSLAIYAARQWRDTNATLNEIRLQTPEVKKSADAAKKSADVSQQVADSNDATTKETLRMMEGQLQASQILANSAKATQQIDERKLFYSERPQLVIIDVQPPSIAINLGMRGLGFTATVENRGHSSSQTTILVGRVIFQTDSQRLLPIVEMKAQCERPNPFDSPAGVVIAPNEKKPVFGAAEIDVSDVRKHIDLAPMQNGEKSLLGYLFGCVIYRSNLSNNLLHSGFAYLISARLSQKTLSRIQEVGDKSSQEDLFVVPSEEITFTPAPVINGYSN